MIEPPTMWEGMLTLICWFNFAGGFCGFSEGATKESSSFGFDYQQQSCGEILDWLHLKCEVMLSCPWSHSILFPLVGAANMHQEDIAVPKNLFKFLYNWEKRLSSRGGTSPISVQWRHRVKASLWLDTKKEQVCSSFKSFTKAHPRRFHYHARSRSCWRISYSRRGWRWRFLFAAFINLTAFFRCWTIITFRLWIVWDQRLTSVRLCLVGL